MKNGRRAAGEGLGPSWCLIERKGCAAGKRERMVQASLIYGREEAERPSYDATKSSRRGRRARVACRFEPNQ